MIHHWLADLVFLIHLAFLVFVGAGAFLVLRWPRLAWIHAPAAVWGILIEYVGWYCPLTPLEVWLRRRAGEAGYEGGFIDHYIGSLIYPEGLPRSAQIVLGSLVLVVNGIVYGWLLLRRRRRGDKPT
jgi:hypothetical protein